MFLTITNHQMQINNAGLTVVVVLHCVYIYIYEPNMGINSEKDELYFYILLK